MIGQTAVYVQDRNKVGNVIGYDGINKKFIIRFPNEETKLVEQKNCIAILQPNDYFLQMSV
jgi:hypothetical protein